MESQSQTSGPRAILVLIGIVAMGMAVPAFFRWQVSLAEDNRDQIRRESPTTAEGRLQLYLELASPGIHQAISMSRFSAERPWIVTHVVRSADPKQPPAIYGVDIEDLPRNFVRQEGLDVVISMPAPSLMARDVLVGDNAMGVQVFPAGSNPEGVDILERRLRFALNRMIDSLPKDISAARYRFEFTGWPEPEGSPQVGSEGSRAPSELPQDQ
ncbi:MAG TPA: hypothetical protein EYQ25_06565 [Planctomycetes bacterium]|nr:hypothetical protein [Planctomycetota bacterium]HIL37372.1 hypothetical protein [Planctomycetota bacterium]